jgi:pimeloyl-ACP methyl ester carboxylesterase
MVVDAADATTDVVERMHRTIQMRPIPIGISDSGGTRGITGLVYRNVRRGIRLVGQAVEGSLAHLAALLPEGKSSSVRDTYRSAINGVCGDYLLRTGNPLAIDMSLRFRGDGVSLSDPDSVFEQHSDVPATRRRLLVLVHGLCMNDQHWRRDGHDHGAALADEFGYLPLYLRYNSGLKISDNGEALAEILETLIRNWTQPVDDVVIMGHSMGGLVARSACYHGRLAGHAWLKHLGKLVFLGTPHHGAPLERGGNGLEFLMDLSPYSNPLTRISGARSAGINDLHRGRISVSQHPVKLPSDVKCYALAAVRAGKRSALSERLVGDGLVPLDSALGQHRDTAWKLAIPETRQWVGYRMGHGDLLSSPDVYAQLHSWLQQPS